MENETALYFNGSDPDPIETRMLVFNNAINLYDTHESKLIISFPMKGAKLVSQTDHHLFYPAPDSRQYIRMSADNKLVPVILRETIAVNKHLLRRILDSRTVLFFALLTTVSLSLYFGLIRMVPWLGMKLISIDTEISVGNQLHQTMLANEAVADSAKTDILQQFADKLVLSKTYPIRLTVVKNPAVNAYAVPGGHLVIFNGMLEKISTPDALVALLAHESTHVNRRHTLRSFLRTAANSILISLLLNDVSGIAAALLGNAENLAGLKYSRSLEIEADCLGMEIMLSNQVDPEGMLQLMQVLQAEGDLPRSLAFLSSHPLTRERIDQAKIFMETHRTEIAARNDLDSIFQLVD